MTANSTEKLLWQICTDEDMLSRFRSSPDAFLNASDLDENEKELVIRWDVRRLIDQDVSPLLVMSAFLALHGPTGPVEYKRRMQEK